MVLLTKAMSTYFEVKPKLTSALYWVPHVRT